MVVGYEDWIIIDMLAYVSFKKLLFSKLHFSFCDPSVWTYVLQAIKRAGWEGGALHILTESGYSARLAEVIQKNLGHELEKLFQGEIPRWDSTHLYQFVNTRM